MFKKEKQHDIELKPLKEEIDYGFIVTEHLRGILALSKEDLTNSKTDQNKIANAINYLDGIVSPLADTYYQSDLKEIRKIEGRDEKLLAYFKTIIGLLSRNKMLLGLETPVRIDSPKK